MLSLSSSLYSIALLGAVFSRSSAAFNPATDRAECQNGGFCLTSFQWCSTADRYNAQCSYPPKVYPGTTHEWAASAAAISYFDNYTISWQNADTQYPIVLEWFPGAVPTLSRLSSWGFTALWTRNVTGSELTLYGAEFYSQLITDQRNYTEVQNRLLLTQAPGVVRLSQPDRPAPAGFVANETNLGLAWVDESQRFVILQDSYIETAVSLANNATNRRWRLGVGIGVGLGVPILLLLTFWLAASLGVKRGIAKQRNQGLTTKEAAQPVSP